MDFDGIQLLTFPILLSYDLLLGIIERPMLCNLTYQRVLTRYGKYLHSSNSFSPSCQFLSNHSPSMVINGSTTFNFLTRAMFLKVLSFNSNSYAKKSTLHTRLQFSNSFLVYWVGFPILVI